MSSLNEKGRKRVTKQIKALTVGYIHHHIDYNTQNLDKNIFQQIIQACTQYIDPALVWVAMRVFIRVASTDNSSSPVISADSKSVTVANVYDPDSESQVSLTCHCNHVFTGNTESHDMFHRTGKPLMDALLCGYNTALIAYGASTSGAHCTLFGSYTHDPLTVDLSSIDLKTEYCLIADDGLYQRCMKYLLSQLQARKLNATTDSKQARVMKWELTLQHVYTYPEQQLLDDALVNKHAVDDEKQQQARRGRQAHSASTGGSQQWQAQQRTNAALKIRQRRAFDELTNKIVIENARTVRVERYREIKHWWQVAHDNIFASQLRYAKVEQAEAKSNYEEFSHSINQVISLDLHQYMNDGTMLESNVKFILPKYYAGHADSYQHSLDNDLPAGNFHKSVAQQQKQHKQSLYPTFLLQDPLYTACSALAKDLMPRFRDSHFTYICKDVLGGNCKTCMLLHCDGGSGSDEEESMHLVKCVKFAQVVSRIYCNPKMNAHSILEWSRSYDALKEKYDALNRKMNEMRKQVQSSKRAKSAADMHLQPMQHAKQTQNATQRVDEYHNGRKVLKQGFLNKEGGVIKSVKIRYFVLFETRQLSYYDDVTSKTPIATIDIKHDFKSVQKVNWLQDDTYNFHGFILSTKKRAWKLCSGSVNEVNEWIKLLQTASGQM